MNIYEADIWRSVYHNDKFSHTVQRKQLIHAMNKQQAEKKITLEPEKLRGEEPLIIKASPETIYRLEQTGTVTIQPYYVYSDGRSPRPVK